MNPENAPTPREEIEMRLTALLLGELPPEETAALQAAHNQSRRNRAKRRQAFLRTEYERRDRSCLYQYGKMKQPQS